MIRRTKEKLVLQYDSTVSFFADAVRRMQAHEGFKRYFKNTGWLFFGRMFGLAASFFVGVYMARYLGPVRYGLFNYAASFAGLFAVFAGMGIDSILSRELIKDPARRSELLGTSFYLKLVGGVSATLLATGVSLLATRDLSTSLLILLFSFATIFQAFNVVDFYFQSQVLSKKSVRIQLAATGIGIALKLSLIFFGLGVTWFVVAYVLESVFLAVGYVAAYRNMHLTALGWKFNAGLARELLGSSWPLMLSGGAIMVYMKIDQIMIRQMMSDEAVGLYSVAAKISEVWYFIPGIICTSLFPAIINAKKVGPAMYERRLEKLYALMIYLSVCIALPVSFLAKDIVHYLFGAAYLGAATALQIHIWAGIGVFTGYAVTQYLIAENYTKIFFTITIGGAISNVVLNILLIPHYGINGAAIATVFSYTFTTFSVVFFEKTKKQIYLMGRSILIAK